MLVLVLLNSSSCQPCHVTQIAAASAAGVCIAEGEECMADSTVCNAERTFGNICFVEAERTGFMKPCCGDLVCQLQIGFKGPTAATMSQQSESEGEASGGLVSGLSLKAVRAFVSNYVSPQQDRTFPIFSYGRCVQRP